MAAGATNNKHEDEEADVREDPRKEKQFFPSTLHHCNPRTKQA